MSPFETFVAKDKKPILGRLARHAAPMISALAVLFAIDMTAPYFRVVAPPGEDHSTVTADTWQLVDDGLSHPFAQCTIEGMAVAPANTHTDQYKRVTLAVAFVLSRTTAQAVHQSAPNIQWDTLVSAQNLSQNPNTIYNQVIAEQLTLTHDDAFVTLLVPTNGDLVRINAIETATVANGVVHSTPLRCAAVALDNGIATVHN